MGQASRESSRQDLIGDAAALKSALRTCIDWTVGQLCASADDVVLTNGTTEACDIALRSPRPQQPRSILVTNHAHPTIIGAAERAAAYLSRITGAPVEQRVVDVPTRLDLCPKLFASDFVNRCMSVSGGLPAYLVLEHITSLGLRLPVVDVAQQIESRGVPIHLIIDGAQAVGPWPVGELGSADYIGCFHKYANGPLETGFAVVRGVDTALLPHAHATRLRRMFENDGEQMPTLDLQKWTRCAAVLNALPSAAEMAAQLKELRAVLLSRGLPLHPTTAVQPDSPYGSHIVTIDAVSTPRADGVLRRLTGGGWIVTVRGRYVRVSLHHSVTVQQLDAFAVALKAALCDRTLDDVRSELERRTA